MSLNSVNTNIGAQIALESLNATNNALAATQKQISTGYRVSDATDDGAAYAVAQRVRSDVSALTTANQQLQGVSGLLGTTTSALNDISNKLQSARDNLLELSNSGTVGAQRTQYAAQYQADIAAVRSALVGANYNARSLIGGITGTVNANGAKAVSVVQDEVGATYTVTTFNGSALYNALTFTKLVTSTTAAASIAALITTTGSFLAQFNSVNTQLNTYGSETNYISGQVSFNSDKIDSLNAGLGALVDADLAKESAQLQSLQIKQQLGTQALTISNQSPNALLKLFGL